MVKYENHCTGCSDLGLPCIGRSCPNTRVPMMYCDNSRCIAHSTGADRLFVVDGSQLCMDCIDDMASRSGIDAEDLIEGEV